MPESGVPLQGKGESRFARHPVRWRAAVGLVCLILLAAAGEMILAQRDLPQDYRAAAPARFIHLREWQPDTTFAETPPAIRRLNPGGAVLDEYRYETDRDGFIKPSALHDDPEVEIVFLGGSTTETLFVSTEQRFPYLAGRVLEARTGKRINSYNGGKSGNNVLHSTIILEMKVLPMAPAYVVLMHAANDIAVLSQYGSYWPDDRGSGDIRTTTPGQTLVSALRTLRDLTIPRTYHVLRHGLTAATSQGVGGTPIQRAAPDPALPQATALWGAQFRSALLTFVRTAEAWNIRPVLMTQALAMRDVRLPERDDGGAYLAPQNLARAGFTADSFRSTHELFNAITRDVARETGALLVDLERAYAWGPDELYDGLHLSDNGSALVARLIADALAADMR
jgi:lysophospholipase L1-like esterase